ncbi:MAG: PBP1A family penicillin-binding protein [Alphaproteobacteria bacterium]|nr:PBP1A family penicillin-binding protein [Alphaproteobacteria bacterium]
MSDVPPQTPEPTEPAPLHEWSEPRHSRRPWWFWLASGFGSCVLFASLMFVVMYYAYAPELPKNVDLNAINKTPSITLTDAAGRVFASRGAAFGYRLAVGEMPTYLPEAFIIMEDRRFYSHSGVDIRGLVRALFVNLSSGGVVQGGSTITQQLAKNTFLKPERTWSRKLEEVFLAFWLERHFNKDQILTLYLNRIYLGAGAYGVDAAAREYFGKSAGKVTLAEAAMLAALTRAPSRYSPEADLAMAQARAAIVIDQLLADGKITKEQADNAKKHPAKPVLHEGTESANYFADFVMDQLTKLNVPLDKDVIVRTTIDTKLQAVAQRTLTSVLDKDGPKRHVSQGALVAMEPDGAVRSLVGGKDWTTSNFNRAYQARRQPGSSFKPFVYLAALEAGLTPDTERDDAPYENRGWTPGNYDGNYLGTITLREALARSINTVAIRLADEVTRTAIIRVAQRLGITSPLAPNRSLPLGTSEVTLYEMVRSFAAFANNGNKTEPYVILDVRTTDGTMLYEHKAAPATPVIAPLQLAEMNQMMFEVTQTGTGRRADLSPRPAAAKTGTSQDWRDAWFVGYTADLVTGVWVGNDDNSSMARVVGGSIPATIWKAYMLAAEKNLPVRTLPGIDMFGQTGEDYAEVHSSDSDGDMPWVDGGDGGRRDRHEDRGVLEEFFDSIFGGDDDEDRRAPPPPDDGYGPRSELVPTRPSGARTASSAAPPSKPLVITVPPSTPSATATVRQSSGAKSSDSDGPYRQPQPDADAGSPF